MACMMQILLFICARPGQPDMRCQSGVRKFAEFNGESFALAFVWVIAFLALDDLIDHADPLGTSVQH